MASVKNDMSEFVDFLKTQLPVSEVNTVCEAMKQWALSNTKIITKDEIDFI